MLKEEPILSGLVLFLGASNFIVLGFILYQSYLNIVDGTTCNINIFYSYKKKKKKKKKKKN